MDRNAFRSEFLSHVFYILLALGDKPHFSKVLLDGDLWLSSAFFLSINPLSEKLSMVHLSYCLDRGLSPNKSSFYNVLESCIRPAALVFKPSCERLNQSGNLSYYHTTRLLINQQLHELCPTSVRHTSFSELLVGNLDNSQTRRLHFRSATFTTASRSPRTS